VSCRAPGSRPLLRSRTQAGPDHRRADVDFRVDVYLGELAAVAGGFTCTRWPEPCSRSSLAFCWRGRSRGPSFSLGPGPQHRSRGLLDSCAHRRSRRDRHAGQRASPHGGKRLNVSHRVLTEVLVRALGRGEEATGSLRRLADASAIVLRAPGAIPDAARGVELGALLHDIGEIRVPEAVLQKPGLLGASRARDRPTAIRNGPGTSRDGAVAHAPRSTWSVAITSATTGPGTLTASRERRSPLTAGSSRRWTALTDDPDRPYRRARPLAEALDILREECRSPVRSRSWTRR